ncbi:hypothetical protein [Gemmatimonas sp.]
MILFRSIRRSRSSVVAASTPSADTTAVVAGLASAGALVATLLVASAAHAAPADRELFTWSGRVDREVYITMRGRDVRTTGVDARLPNRARVGDALPRGRGDVRVRRLDGRGDVRVIEQPSARNGYTTVIRISDDRGGADNYRVAAYWDGDDRFDRDDRNGRDRDNRDDRWGRDDCGPNNNGRGGGWGRGGRQDDCDYRPGRGNDNRNDRDRDRDDRGGWNDRDGQIGGSGSLRWSGRVDDVVEIRISGRRVDAITRSGQRVEDVNSNVRGGGLPSRAVSISIDRHSGRGNVQVVQQPSAWNNYTAVIRIYDPQGGASWYDFSAFWN